jgi:tetratricopeptide (TPR) repeat protein
MEERLRSLFFTGNYPKVLESAQSSTAPQNLLLVIRSLLEYPSQKFPNIDSLQGIPHENVKLLERYLKKQIPATQLLENVNNDALGFGELIRGIVLINEGEPGQVIDSLKVSQVESYALVASALLKLRRPDAAEALAKQGLEKDDEEGVLLFIEAIICIAKGEYDEAYSTLNELVQQYGESPALLNAIAICTLQDANYEEADMLLNKALEQAKALSNSSLVSTTLMNMIAFKRQQGLEVAEYENALREVRPDSDYFKLLKQASALFDSLVE